MQLSRVQWIIACLLIQIVLGCRPSISTTTVDASVDKIDAIAITVHDTYFGESNSNIDSPPTWTVPKGADILATVQNLGTLTHNWAIMKPGMNIPIPFNEGQSSEMILYGAGMIYGQNQTTLTFTAPAEIGDYLVICTVPGHYPSMQGRLVVK